jgi:hypothetical protein
MLLVINKINSNNLISFPQPQLNDIGGGFLLSVDLGCKDKTVVWLEYGIEGI